MGIEFVKDRFLIEFSIFYREEIVVDCRLNLLGLIVD